MEGGKKRKRKIKSFAGKCDIKRKSLNSDRAKKKKKKKRKK